MVDARAEQVEVFAFLQNVGRHQHARIPRHTELPNQALIDTA